MTTLKGRVLLGWMDRDVAIKFLLNDCHFDPPIDEPAAEAIWQASRATVAALPDRPSTVSPNIGLNAAELGHQSKFLSFLRTVGPHDIVGVHKVDIRDLVVRQHYVVTERAESYAQRLQTPRAWLDECLPTMRRNSQIQLRSTQTGMNTYTEIDLPHSEFYFGPNLQNGIFTANEFLRHVTIMDGPDRTYLWAGYHRCFARVLSAPPAAVPNAVVAVARNVLVTPAPTIAALGVATAVDPFGQFGAKAARFGDFFVEGLFMEVDLRKKRYQLQVHANWAAIDDPT